MSVCFGDCDYRSVAVASSTIIISFADSLGSSRLLEAEGSSTALTTIPVWSAPSPFTRSRVDMVTVGAIADKAAQTLEHFLTQVWRLQNLHSAVGSDLGWL